MFLVNSRRVLFLQVNSLVIPPPPLLQLHFAGTWLVRVWNNHQVFVDNGLTVVTILLSTGHGTPKLVR